MSPQLASAASVGNAARALTAACQHLCADQLGKALHALYDETVREPIPDDMLNKLRGLK